MRTLRRLVGTLDSYLFQEAFGLYLFGFLGFMTFLIVNQFFLEGEKLLNPHTPAKTVFALIYLRIPYFITLSAPIAMLFSTLMSMGRLQKDNETTAFFTNGISLYRLFLPYLFLSIISAVVVFWVHDQYVSRATRTVVELQEKFPQVRDETEEEKRNDPFIVSLPRNRSLLTYYFNRGAGQMVNITIDDSIAPEDPKLITARNGFLSGLNITLNGVRIYHLNKDGNIKTVEDKPTYSITSGLPLKEIYSDIRSPEEITARELSRQIQESGGLGENINRRKTEYFLKYSIPFASIAFALIAVPLSLKAPRDERMLGPVFTFILVMSYYFIYFMAKIMGYNAALPPWLAAWTQNIVYLLATAVIFYFARK